MRFRDLPMETIALICTHCTQADLVNLVIACPSLSNAILPAVYQCIVIDTVPRALYRSRAWKTMSRNGNTRLCPVSTVHTVGGIKQLLDTIAAYPHHASLIRSFCVRGNVAMSDNVLIPRVRQALRRLDKIIEFEWTACPELPPDILSEFSHDQNGTNFGLTALTLDLATRPGQCYPQLQFPNLRKLRIRPYLNSQVLVWLRDIAKDCADLEDIQLYRFLDTKLQVGSSFAFVGLSDVHNQHELCPAVSVFFFAAPQLRRQLTSLSLVQVDTAPEDSETLRKNVDMSMLRNLKLIGSGKEDEANHNILLTISNERPKLETVELDWNASHSVLNTFLFQCCASTRDLKLTIKEQPFETLRSVQRNCTRLTNLELQIDCDFTAVDLTLLAFMKNLRVLKLPFNYAVNSWEISLTLPRLKVLKLHWKASSNETGLSSSARPNNMGLLAGGGDGFDPWNDLNRPPMQCARIVDAMKSSPGVEYVVVDGHVTALKPGAPPLETYTH